MRVVRVLGSAAGGGLPQWNCSCANCLAARAGKIPPQTQSSIAISADDQSWFLINASPDLPRQIEMTPALQPQRDPPRNSPIAAILLTNADLDHALGLLLMRQQPAPIVVYATNETAKTLAWIDIVLKRFSGIEWRLLEPSPGDSVVPLSLRERVGVRAIALGESVAFQFRDEHSGVSALIAPAVGELTEELREAVNTSAIVLFDGTFWSDDELGAVRPGARTAREMNHLPIRDGSLELLRTSPARRKIYTHINNTNPILTPGSSERRQVEQAGIEIACDGLEIVL